MATTITQVATPPRAARLRARSISPRTWKWFLAVTVPAALAYGLLPHELWKEPLYDGLVMCAFFAIWIAVRARRPSGANQWTVLLAAMGLIAAAEWVWFANDVRGISPLPGWGELLDLGGRAFLLVALARLSAGRGQFRDRRALLDAAVVGFAVAALAWTFLFGHYFGRADVAVFERLTSATYVAFDLSLLVGFVLLAFDVRRGSPALRLLTLGVGVLVVGDFTWLTLLAHGRYEVGVLSDALWPIAYAIIAAAALHPSMSQIGVGQSTSGSRDRGRLLMLPVALVALPVGDLVAQLLHIEFSLVEGLVVGLGTIAVALIVSARFLDLVRVAEVAAGERGRKRTEALIRESLDVVVVVGYDGRVGYASPPLERVLGWSPEAVIGQLVMDVIPRSERALALEYFERVVASDFGVPFTFTMNILTADDHPVLMEIACVNRFDDPEINGIVLSGRDISERTRLELEVEFYARHDRLTRLSNRSRFLDRVDEALRTPGGRGGAVLVLDLDDFKSVNDSFGPAVGDELLVSIAERLRSCVRPGDTVARLGGDEFALYFETLHPADVESASERLMEVLRLPLTAGAHELAVATSVGVRLLDDCETAQSALRDADIAMYAAKWAGKGCVRVFDAEMGAQASRRVGLLAALPGAWERDEMHVHYQPIVDMRTSAVLGAEALLRWTHPGYGSVPPDEFIRVAEATGAIRELGLAVLREAVRNAVAWRLGGIPDFYVSVNVSPVQLDETFPDAVGGILAAAGLSPCALLIEITENVVLANVDASLRVLSALRSLGLRIAIDDFGTGYSSLAYAQRFPIDLVKIDQSFTRELDEVNSGLVPTIVDLARTMGAQLVAEGVETHVQAQELLRLGCVLAQGFLYSPGLHRDTMSAVVRRGMLFAAGEHAVRPLGGLAPALAIGADVGSQRPTIG